MSQIVRKRTFGYVHPAKSYVSLRIRTLEALLGACLESKDAKFFHADNEDTDQTVLMCRLF